MATTNATASVTPNTVCPELYTKGTRVWIKHKRNVWKCAELKESFNKQNDKYLLLIPCQFDYDEQDDHSDDGEDDDLNNEIKIEINDIERDLPPLKNPDILIGSNDLTCLSYLHEPSVLYNLRIRFLKHKQIYTWCGIVLVAINPFNDLDIYGEDIIRMYHTNLSNLSQMDPHIYAVAEDSFTKLERNNINQSIIVSGESGAGKTVSAKFAMRYFASIAGSDSNIESRVLASNPIMEAIGNAKTIRNDNSSRFGKYIQILFDRRNRHIMGGNMRTYLLEKSRVTYQSDGERNFHIFYQLCTYAKQQTNLSYLELNDREFQYLGTSSISTSMYDDMTKFIDALKILCFSDKQRNIIFSIIAAILHGGNIMFSKRNSQDDDDEYCQLSDENSLKSLKIFCRLLDLNETITLKWLTSRLLKTGGHEIITTPLNVQMAQYGLEALLKFLYEKLFHWIVSIINQSLRPHLKTQSMSEFQFIGVLDIYGFEHFENNSFEQFCINYANERLQQQFNLHVFKLEQDEYIREGIDWTMITFTDNQFVIDLIESKPIGILSLLDEECRMPKGNDRTWCEKLHKQIPSNANYKNIFKKSKFNYQTTFIIEHFADVVTYNVDGFLEKNRDTIWEEQIDLLKRSSVAESLFIDFDDDDEDGNNFIKSNLDDNNNDVKSKTTVKKRITASPLTYDDRQRQKKKKSAKATIGFQFRQSLDALMKILNSTEPHYVRCIKPNDRKAAFEFNNIRAVQQLRACGVLETIRISSNGYPSRWSYQDFASRYRVLRVGNERRKSSKSTAKTAPKPTPRKLVRAGSSFAVEIRSICEDIVRIVYEEKIFEHLNIANNDVGNKSLSDNQQQQQQITERKPYQFGKTKIFFRPGQVALLERIRSQKLRECAILIQKMIRGWIRRKIYGRIRTATIELQRHCRGYLARKRYQHMRQTKAATIIQKYYRCHRERKRYESIRNSVNLIQKQCRGYLARKRYEQMRRNRAAITIQRYWRGYIQRKHYQSARRKIIIAQSCVRRYLAKKEYRRLRIEARSVEHVKNLNKGLEKKIMTLQERIDDLLEENRQLKSTEGRFNNLRKDMEQLNEELAEMKLKQRNDQTKMNELQSQIEKLLSINADLEQKVVKSNEKKSEFEAKIREYQSNQKRLEENISKLNDSIQMRESELRNEFDQERRKLLKEMEQEKMMKQQLLSKYMDLEERYNALLYQKQSNNSNNNTDNIADYSNELKIINGIDNNNEIIANNNTANNDDNIIIDHINVDNHNSLQSLNDFDSNLDRISIMMQCTELEQELKKLTQENQQLRKQLAKSIDERQPNASAQLLSEQFQDLQNELKRYKKERSDLKRVILMEDHLTTFNGDEQEKVKFQNDLQQTYKNLFAKLDEQIAQKDEMIRKLKNENLYFKCNSNPNNNKSQSLPYGTNIDINTHNNYNNNNNGSTFMNFNHYDHQQQNNHRSSSLIVDYNNEQKNLRGMFKFLSKDIVMINRLLFYEFDPTKLNHMEQCYSNTIAFITYMCLRYADSIDGEKCIHNFIAETLSWLSKKAQHSMDKSNNIEILIYLLSTSFKISILMKYYSEYNNEVEDVQPVEVVEITQTEHQQPQMKSEHSTQELEIDPQRKSPIISHSNNIDSGFNDADSQSNGTDNNNNNDDNVTKDLTLINANNGNNSKPLGLVIDDRIYDNYEQNIDLIQALKKFDLSEFMDCFRELITKIYLLLVDIFQKRITPLIVPAVLEHQELSGMSLRQKRDDSSSDPDSGPPSPTEYEIHTLFKELSNIQALFRIHRVDDHFSFQFFRQIFYFIGATAINNLMLRKDLCTNERAIEIVYNISLFEQFLRENKIMNWEEVKAQMDPILQATKLLISSKTEKQIPAIVLTTKSLTIPQIFKIINMYTPSDAEVISKNFIDNLMKELETDRQKNGTAATNSSSSAAAAASTGKYATLTAAKTASTSKYLLGTAKKFPLGIPYLMQTSVQTKMDTNILQATDLECDFRKIDIPICLQRLERYLEKI